MLWGWAYTLQAAAAAGPGRGRWLCSAFPRLADAGGGPHRCRNRSFGQPAGDITRCRLRARLGEVRLQAGTGDAPLLCTVSRHGCPHCGASEVRRDLLGAARPPRTPERAAGATAVRSWVTDMEVLDKHASDPEVRSSSHARWLDFRIHLVVHRPSAGTWARG